MSTSRRGFLARFATAGAGLFVGRKSVEAQDPHAGHQPPAPAAPPQSPRNSGAAVPAKVSADELNLPRAVFETPDIPKLPFRIIEGVKEFHLSADVVRTEFLPGKVVDAWGYSGSVPGPTIEAEEGDRVRVIFHNNLPEMTTVHWHGLEVPMAQDGVPGLGQDPTPPGGMHTYEFTLNQNGTFFYHAHFAMQEMMGMVGFFIIHPKNPHTPRVDRDFGLILQGWALLPNNTVPNTLSMEFNWLTLNGKAGPATTPMLAKKGERIRIRFVNLGMDHHPMHLHGNQFVVTGTEGGRIPESGWFPGNTVVVGVAQARDVEFEAKYEGDWMVHCHLPHHMMNQMVSMVGPMSRGGQGAPTGLGMEEGMGIVRQGNALDDDLGPGLGRGLGMAADRERPASPLVGQAAAQAAGHEGHVMPGMSAENAQNVPGFPQDMWMPMDEMVAGKPEVYGLRKDWTGAMMGMMTLVRVLPSELYDKIMELKADADLVEGYTVSFRTEAATIAAREETSAHVVVMDPSRNVVSNAVVRMTLLMPAMPSMGMSEMRVDNTLQWNGSDYSGPLTLFMVGPWNVIIEVEQGGRKVAIYRTRLDAQ